MRHPEPIPPAPLVEVRIPTYNRPAFLRRALLALINQSHDNWKCVVFDDSPHGEGRSVVEALADSRILYHQNPENLGAAGNIDQAFDPRPYAGGEFMFVLEDDNLVLPEHIATTVAKLQQSGCKVAHVNQLVETPAHENDLAGELSSRGISCGTLLDGIYDPPTFSIGLLAGTGVSNGGLFWHASARSNFRIGPLVNHAGHQEYVRALRVHDPVLVCMEPTAVWRANGEHSQRNVPGLQSQFLHDARTIQMLRQAAVARSRLSRQPVLLDRFDPACHRRLEEGTRGALRRWPGKSSLPLKRRVELAMKALALNFVRAPAGVALSIDPR